MLKGIFPRNLLGNLQTIRSLKNPVFRLYLGAMLSQMASMNMQMMARSLLLYRVTDSATLLGVMALANALPMLFLSMFGGVIADRLPKKKVLLVGQTGSAIISLAVTITLVFDILSADRANSWLILVVAALLQGIVQGLMMPSRQAMVAEIVGEEQLMNAMALYIFGVNILRMGAPAIAGLVIDLFGFEAVYAIVTGLYVLALVFIVLVPHSGTSTMIEKGDGPLADLVDGLRFVRRETTILLLLIVNLFMVLLSMPYMQLLPIFTEDILHVGATGMGVLIGASGVGAVVGSLVLASLPNRRRGLMLLLSGVILGLSLTAFSFSTWLYLSLALMVFLGVGLAGRSTLGVSLLQIYVPSNYRGRVISIYQMEFGLTSFAVFFAAILTESIGVQWAVGGLAITLATLSILSIVFVSSIRKLD